MKTRRNQRLIENQIILIKHNWNVIKKLPFIHETSVTIYVINFKSAKRFTFFFSNICNQYERKDKFNVVSLRFVNLLSIHYLESILTLNNENLLIVKKNCKKVS